MWPVGGQPQGRELNNTVCVWDGDGARKGRDGVNPSTTHLSVSPDKMCRRRACPFAPLVGAGAQSQNVLFSSRLWGTALAAVRPVLLQGSVGQEHTFVKWGR
jgi:hypothetical protein